ncbi:MAG: DUF6992 family protein [Flavobacteriales bacterium]
MKFFSVLLFSAFLSSSIAQDQTYAELMHKDRKTLQNGMYTLSGWATTNITVGLIGYSLSSGENQRFHEMNMYWNCANLGLAVSSLLRNKKMMKYKPLMGEEALHYHYNTEKLFLFNTGLDFAYISSGFLLREIGKNHPTRSDIYKGYGTSVITQGAFLLLFDAYMYHRLRKNVKSK